MKRNNILRPISSEERMKRGCRISCTLLLVCMLAFVTIFIVGVNEFLENPGRVGRDTAMYWGVNAEWQIMRSGREGARSFSFSHWGERVAAPIHAYYQKGDLLIIEAEDGYVVVEIGSDIYQKSSDIGEFSEEIQNIIQEHKGFYDLR